MDSTFRLLHWNAFDTPLECFERFCPEAIEVVAQRGKRVGVERVHALVAARLVDHEPRVLQDSEVLGNSGAADGKVAREFDDRQRAVLEQARQDRATSAVADGIERGVLVSNH